MKNKSMKKTLFLFALSLTIIGVNISNAIAANDSDTVTPVSLTVDSTIAISCTDSVSMSPIVSTGQSVLDSDNEATCNIDTNNSAGYKLEWLASSATMSNGSDTIAAYTSATPEVWSVASADSEWGARLKSTSDDYASGTWGTTITDDYGANSNWFNVSSSVPYQIASRSSETASGGSDEVIQFGAEIGSSKVQPTGDYQVDVTFTATTL